MDESISRWILEFLLRQPIKLRIINNILSSLPISTNNTDNRLKKTLLLKIIESETLNGTISEKILDHLETIEELDHTEGKSPSNSLKLAYCLVAVDCTVRFLERNAENNATYFEAVERIWRDRVCKVESLLSEESNRWLGEIEAAVWDSGVCEKILRRNTRNEALEAVRVYLAESWGSLGPSFLERVAEKGWKDLGPFRGGGRLGNPCREMLVVEGTQMDPAPVRRKHVAMKGKRSRGAKISDADEGHEDETVIKSKCRRSANMSDVGEVNVDESMNKGSASPTPQMDGAQAVFVPSFVEQNSAGRNDLPGAPQLSGTLTPAKATDNIDNNIAVENQTEPNMTTSAEVVRVLKALKTSSMELHASVRDPLPEALQVALALSSTIATDNICSMTGLTAVEKPLEPEINAPRDSTENGTENVKKNILTQGAYVQVQGQKDRPTKGAHGQAQEQEITTQSAHGQVPEQEDSPTQGAHGQVQEQEDSPTQGAHGQVQEQEDNPTEGVHDQVQEQKGYPAQCVRSQVEEEKDDPTQGAHTQVQEEKENTTQGVHSQAQEEKANPAQGAQGQVQEQRGLRKLPKFSLMEPNGTSHTYEWDDSIDNVSGDSFRQPYHLNFYVETKVTRRRGRKCWTPEEEEALRKGVNQFGKGHWKLILTCYREVFQDRTDVDLKDKWRNMTRSR